jgi:hypothetical protein
MHEVQSSKDIKTFLQIAITINANDPQWIRPLDKDIEEVFDEKNYEKQEEMIDFIVQSIIPYPKQRLQPHMALVHPLLK